ncbi:DUF4956 domain-containing protein [Leucobacter triazinivorans]|uniref:DUF4956 domain-containing protein n=1 Tax=Leucobacter triazinivorans TaxID=1784719 RepID=UPI001F0ECBAA|nr:DUF4956 domain-containing protein [Leucobacter triazinivorans]
MSTSSLILIAVDLVAALILALGLYYPRHRRRDLVVAFLGVNIGVLAVTSVLGGAEIAAGLGLGLFGVLSIIRLRSSEISQREVAYYFSALAMGLIGGLSASTVVVPSLLIALILVVMWAADHPALLARSRHQVVRLDRAITDESELRAELSERLGAPGVAAIPQVWRHLLTRECRMAGPGTLRVEADRARQGGSGPRSRPRVDWAGMRGIPIPSPIRSRSRASFPRSPLAPWSE